MPNAPNIAIHPQPLKHQGLHPLLHPQVRHPRLGRNALEQRALLDVSAQQPAPTSEPEENQVELGAREELDRDVEEACVAGAESEGFEGEAVAGDVGEGCGEDGALAICVGV